VAVLFRKALDRWRRGERGQSLAIFAIAGALMIALLGISVDVGQLLWTRSDLQKAADAAAMAGAQNLPVPGLAQVTARDYVERNSGSSTESTIEVYQTNGPNDTIKVTARKRVNYMFVRVLGLTGSEVTATAVAQVQNYVGGSGLVPWGFVANSTNSCFLGFSGGAPQFVQNQSCTLKSGAPGAGGDFGAICLDQCGADTYRANIINGSKSSFKLGDKVDTQTGNLVGPTSQATKDRMNRPPPSGCTGNTVNDVLKTNSDGSVSIKPGCENSGRIVLIPVVDQINNPQQSTILGFAFMFMEDVKDQGGHTQVTGRFVKFVTAIPGGDYSGTSNIGATAVRMVQ
jgi:Flp pilus assembly protein TadG